MAGVFKVALAQTGSRLGNVKTNLQKHLEFVGKARQAKASFVVFPELSLTGYMLRDLAYEIAPECKPALRKIARASKGIYTILGFVDEPRPGIYRNSAALLYDGRMLGVVPKSYLPSYGLFEEKRYFKEGEAKDLKVFKTQFGKIGITICEDLWHPEPGEALARLGADVLFCISSSPIRGFYGSSSGRTVVERAWEKVLAARAIENTVYVVFVNRAGAEDEEYFWGGSTIISPDGVEVVKAKHLSEDFVLGEIDPNRLVRVRRFSSFRDHRKDFHRLLEGL